MSQQEYFPGPQENEEQSYYYTPPTQRHKNEPKEEHPSQFTGEIPPYSYQAQDRGYNHLKYRDHASHTNQQARTSGSQREAPAWARPQRHRGSNIWRILIACVVIFLAIKLVPLLIVGVLALFGAAFIIILGLFIVIGLLLLLVLLGLLILLGIPLLRLVNRMRL
jgi:hypothetical protein